MPDTHSPSSLPTEMAARALGAALLEDGLMLMFDAETGALVHANDPAIFLLEMSEDALGDHGFDTLCRASEPTDPDLWRALRSGTVSRWHGELVSTLSMSEHPVSVLTALSEGEDGSGRVILHATEERATEATGTPAPSGALGALGDVVGIIEFDADGIVTAANDRAKMALEFYSDEMAGRGHDSLWPAAISQTPDYVDFWNKLREGRIVEGRYAHVSAEGNTVWLQSTYVPQRGETGHVAGVIQCLMDVTDDTERAVADAARAGAAWSSLAVAELDLEGHVTSANTRMQTLLGCGPEELTGKHVRRFMDQEFALGSAFRGAWDKVVGGEPQEIDVPHASVGHQICWTRSQFIPVTDATGKIARIFEIGVDIHEDHERLARLQRRHDALNEDLAIVEWDVTGRLIDGNSRYADLLGLDRGKLEGLDHRTTVPEDFAASRRYALFWDKLNQGERVAGQFRRRGSDGKDAWLQASYVPLRREIDGRVETVLFFASDITEVKLGQLHAQARMDAIERSMAVIEFEMDGTILSANKVFVETVGYSLEELKGRKHAMLCPPDFAKSEEYRRFWERLGEGQIIEQEVRRVGVRRKGALVPGQLQPDPRPYRPTDPRRQVRLRHHRRPDPAGQAGREMADHLAGASDLRIRLRRQDHRRERGVPAHCRVFPARDRGTASQHVLHPGPCAVPGVPRFLAGSRKGRRALGLLPQRRAVRPRHVSPGQLRTRPRHLGGGERRDHACDRGHRPRPPSERDGTPCRRGRHPDRGAARVRSSDPGRS